MLIHVHFGIAVTGELLTRDDFAIGQLTMSALKDNESSGPA